MRQGVFTESGNWEKTAYKISGLLQSYSRAVEEEQIAEVSVPVNPSQSKRARQAYNKHFSHYPDILNIQQFAKMAGIGETLARKVTKEGYIQSIAHVTKGWQFPKRWVIDYLLSDHYLELMRTLNLNSNGKKRLYYGREERR